ncbi:hypothetical protein LCGC14_1157290 [marine sediment metagenome]|uniref:Uncharacterized protein n=1 Tax=marine sediment metagenome TaxID=412755 RepID=A0A0F9MGT3_9ZZZZ
MKPLHIDPNCPECGEPLAFLDICDPDIGPETICEDEWACPKCYEEGDCYLDWPQEKLDEIADRVQEAKDHPERCRPWNEIRQKLYKRLGLTEEEIEQRFKESEEKAKNMTEEEIAEYAKNTRVILNIKNPM